MKPLRVLQSEIAACRRCSGVIGPPVHGSLIRSPVYLLGQAPGIHEGELKKPFAWTAGKTLFRWFEEETGVDEEHFRDRIYMAAVGRCFPGRNPGQSTDRKPSREEIEECRPFIEREIEILKPRLLLPVGMLAIEQSIGSALPKGAKLNDIIGKVIHLEFHGQKLDAIPLPHPSGASPWHKLEPGKTLLRKALRAIARHEAWLEAVG